MAKAKSANVTLLQAKQAQLKALRQEVAEIKAVVEQERENARWYRAAVAKTRREEAIKKAEARLAKLTGAPIVLESFSASKQAEKQAA